ncbi:MAG: hypothetical protein ISS19_07355 [Bacteroidales bacterium]|nr:hypothetical protein [Bacteroidales bacterium]
MILNHIIFSLLLLSAQAPFKLVGTIPVSDTDFRTDPMGNVYVIKGNRLIKYNNRQEKIADYSNAYLGEIGSLDATDPLRLLIHYKEFNQLLWLDNYLLELRSPVFLDDLGVDQAEVICASSQGGFWLFNGLNNQIQYFDVNLNLIHESIPINPFTNNNKPVAMVEKNRMVYVHVPKTGILTFDRYGTYSKTLPVFPDNVFQVTDESIFYTAKKIFCKYDLSTFTNTLVNLPEVNEILDIRIQPDFIYLLNPEGIHIYQIKVN